MKLALIADTHFGARSDSHLMLNHFTDFFDNTFFPYLKEHNIDTLIHAGDLCDRRKFINFHTLNKMTEHFIDKIDEYNLTCYMILGNHDVSYRNTNTLNSVTELYGDRNNIIIIDKPEHVEFAGLKFLLMPWINKENHDTSMELLENCSDEYCVGHFEISGFEMHNGITSYQGMSSKHFKNFEKVFSGHYHHRSDDKLIHYLGAPYQITFNDLHDARGFSVFDTTTRDVEFVENKRELFHVYNYNDVDNDENKILVEDVNANKEKFKDSYLRLVIEQKENQFCFDSLVDILMKNGVHDISVFDSTELYKENDDENDTDIEIEDTLHLLDEYITRMSINNEMKNKLQLKMREVYIDAVNCRAD